MEHMGSCGRPSKGCTGAILGCCRVCLLALDRVASPSPSPPPPAEPLPAASAAGGQMGAVGPKMVDGHAVGCARLSQCMAVWGRSPCMSQGLVASWRAVGEQQWRSRRTSGAGLVRVRERALEGVGGRANSGVSRPSGHPMPQEPLLLPPPLTATFPPASTHPPATAAVVTWAWCSSCMRARDWGRRGTGEAAWRLAPGRALSAALLPPDPPPKPTPTSNQLLLSTVCSVRQGGGGSPDKGRPGPWVSAEVWCRSAGN
ncbi:hypothetical protein V8C86DRAFT_2751584 [Haematococcus lacustris]